MKKTTTTHISNYTKCKQTKIINHNTKCRRIIKMEGGGILDRLLVISMSWWGGVVVGGKTANLFLGGEDGWWYQVSGTWCILFVIYLFLFCRKCVSLYVRTWHVLATSHGCIFIEWSADWMVYGVVVVVFTLNMHTKNVDWPLCVTIFSPCMIEASKVDHSASCIVDCWWLLAAVFVSAASIPHLSVFEAGGTLSE